MSLLLTITLLLQHSILLSLLLQVADMNSDIWKSSDTTEDDLETIAIVLNTTRTELQNGLRLLMLEIGKLESKDNDIFTPSKFKA